MALLLILWLPAMLLLKKYTAAPPALLPAWSYTHGAKLSGLLLQEAGSVLAEGEDGQLICLNSETGRLHFSVQKPAGFERPVCLQSDVRGNYYIGDGNGRVLAVDSGGELLWSFDPRPAEARQKVPPGAARAVCFAVSGAAFYGLAADGSMCWALLNPERSLLNVYTDWRVSENALHHLLQDGSVQRIDAAGQSELLPFAETAGFGAADYSQMVIADRSMFLANTAVAAASLVDSQLYSAEAGKGQLSDISRIDYLFDLGAGFYVLGESNSNLGFDDRTVLCDHRLQKLKAQNLGLEYFIFRNGDYVLYSLPGDSGSDKIEAWSRDEGVLWQRSAPAGLAQSENWQAAITGGMLVIRGRELSLLRMNRAE